MTTVTQVKNQLHAVILAGGSGTRLWPLSRMTLPKQFLSLHTDETLLQATVSRLSPMIGPEQVTIVTSAAAAKGEPQVHLAPYKKILEPAARNTAPAIGIAALEARLGGDDPVMVVLPADHLIQDIAGFHSCMEIAIRAARDGKLVTFGILPDKPETGFGYIKAVQASANTSADIPVGLMRVDSFKEKPDLPTAQRFLAEGGYYWNSGMFVWKASSILSAIETSLPTLHQTLVAIADEIRAGKPFAVAMDAHFASAPNISIDHGVLEKAQALFVVPASIGWSDVGSWDAVYDVASKDAQGNATQGNVVAIGCRNNLVRGGKRLVAAVGVEDLSIIETADAILIAKRGESQKVKDVVTTLAGRGATEHVEHLTVRRPWGSYTVLEEGLNYKIKRIEVLPGGRLSLQSHKHRSEHWVVVSGEATITNGDSVMKLGTNESTYIPIGVKHRLENLGTEAVQMIEVQVGAYVGEDDIQRFDDIYGRVG